MAILRRILYVATRRLRSWQKRWHLGVGIFNLTKQSSRLISYRIQMNLTYTRSVKGKVVYFLVLYFDDILLIGNDIVTLSIVKVWLASAFDIKDLGEASYILGIKQAKDNRIISS